MSRPIRVVFMGTPDFAVPSLDALIEHADVEVPLVVSQPDRPAGRGKRTTPPPVASAAAAHGLPLFQPESLRTEDAAERLGKVDADLFVVVAYGQILRQNILDLPRAGCINVHASLLPRWRGAAPIQWAVASGDAVTGVTLMQMERGLDTGPVLAMAASPIATEDTAGTLHDRLASLGARLLAEHITTIAEGTAVATPQAGDRATYARMLTPADRKVPFDNADRTVWHIHGMTPWPGACVALGGETVRVLAARAVNIPPPADAAPGNVLTADPTHGLQIACGDARRVEVLTLQRPGRKPTPAREALRGFSVPVGSSVLDVP